MSNKFVTVEPVENLSIIRKYRDSFPTERDGVSSMQRDPIDLLNWILGDLKECGSKNSLNPIFDVIYVGGLREKIWCSTCHGHDGRAGHVFFRERQTVVNYALSLLLIQELLIVLYWTA